MNVVTFYIARHGETLLNILGKLQGWSDSPLTARGKKEAELQAAGLQNINFLSAYSSDSGRAVDTANIILSMNRSRGITLKRDARLREWCFGSLEATSNQNFIKILSEEFRTDFSMTELNSHLLEIPNIVVKADKSKWAEKFDEITNRVSSVLTDIAIKAANAGGGNILVVTHAFLIKTIIYLYAPNRMNEVEKIRNASITKIIYANGGFEVGKINDIHYLEHGVTSSPSK